MMATKQVKNDDGSKPGFADGRGEGISKGRFQ
jgi:hypothetical protein